MASVQGAADLVLVVLLAATLFHAVRLQRALQALQRDRATLDEVLGNFEASTRAAEAGIERFRQISDGANLQIARQADHGVALKDDLAFLIERGDRLADRMDVLVRAARPIAAEPARPQPGHLHMDPPDARKTTEPALSNDARPRSQAERDLLAALRAPR